MSSGAGYFFYKVDAANRSQLSEGFSEQTVSYLTLYYQDLTLAFDVLSRSDDMFFTALIGVSLDFYHMHFQDFPTELQRSFEKLASYRQSFLEILCKSINATCISDSAGLGICKVAAAASSLAPYLGVLSTSPSLSSGRSIFII